MFHSSAFAIAAGVVGVAGAATSAGMGMAAADRAARAQGAAGKKLQKQTAAATSEYEKAARKFNRQQNKLKQQIAAIDPTINIPQFNLAGATTEGIEAANRATANTLQQLERVAPGSEQARQQVGQIINSYLQGQVPQDVQEQTMRMIAERGGAGFNIATAGRGMAVPSAPQANLARSLGLTSLELQQQGANLAGSWQSIAGQFVARPETFMQFALQGRGQDIDVAQANITNRFRQLGMISDITGQQLGAAQNIYSAQTGQAQTAYGAAQQGIEATLAARQATAQGVQGISSAAAGALGGIGSAYGQLAAAQQPATMYGSLGAAQSAAPYASGFSQVGGLGFVPRATAV